MTVIPAPVAPSDPPPPMSFVEARLRKENEELKTRVAFYERRERHLVRCISEMLNVPKEATSVASAKYDNKTWEVVMSNGAVWQRATKLIDTPTEYRYVETWVPRPAVPGTRAEIVQKVEEALESAPLFPSSREVA